ncbi:hypothetical protein OG271_28380 [Micromonospora rifamycinica]|uniref:hypothetical protein n=1 Tax=Micromonospora rifamycinica TaxID=291594 RepID=UPI002E282902|nr:hypothetical protein [Micromonospora rifamycinica]
MGSATTGGLAARVPPGSTSARPGPGPGGPPRRSLSEAGLGWIAAHGGAGATTLSRIFGGTDLGCRWPDAARAEPATVMLVGRTDAEGMRAVSRALNALREGRHPPGMRLVGLVLLADAPGRLPPPLARRIRVLRSVTPVHRVPWIPAWRLGQQPARAPRALEKLRVATGLAGDGRTS